MHLAKNTRCGHAVETRNIFNCSARPIQTEKTRIHLKERMGYKKFKNKRLAVTNYSRNEMRNSLKIHIKTRLSSGIK